jgi:2-methylcitrate dehydratase
MVLGDPRPHTVTTAVSTWASRLAAHLVEAHRTPLPAAVLDRAAVHLLDSIACAAGAIHAEPVAAARQAIAGSGPPVATVLFGGTRASSCDAVLVNGTAVRYLDANDIFLGTGPGGHPSDNIVVALAAGEEVGASGRDVLAAIALGYELVARIRTLLYRPSRRAGDWHEVSLSGTVAAAMAGLLYGLDEHQLTHAITIGTAKGYALKEIRRGEISAMKACGNALVARDGVLAAQLARAGLTGPPQVFEGESGLFNAMGLDPADGTLDALTAAPAWAICRASMKSFPGLGTSQAAVHAAGRVAATHGLFAPEAVKRVTISLADSPYTRDYQRLDERRRPTTRETADHSIQFLVALALLDGAVTPAHYENAAWTDERVKAVMAVTDIAADPALGEAAGTAFPAIVEVQTADGRVLSDEVLVTPGSPGAPWGREDVVEKFVRFDSVGLGREAIERIADAAIGLPAAADLSVLTKLLT